MQKSLDIYEKRFCDTVRIWFETVYKPGRKAAVTSCAKLFGISQPFMSQILAGNKCPRLESDRRKIAEKIGIPYEEMIGLKAGVTDQTPCPTESTCPSERNEKTIDESMAELMKLPPKKRGIEIVMLAAASNMITEVHVSHGDRKRSDKYFGPLKRYWDGEITEQELYDESYQFFKRIREKADKLLKEHGLK